jgi:hypothetical protein
LPWNSDVSSGFEDATSLAEFVEPLLRFVLNVFVSRFERQRVFEFEVVVFDRACLRQVL